MAAGFVDVEGGVQVQFDTTGTFRTGDYWLIPARTVPGQFGDIVWPKDSGGNAIALLPFGITHHYCRLAILSIAPNLDGNLVTTLVEDCRKKFPPLTELPTGGDNCCSVTVGQGGDYPDLSAALAARPGDADWWTVCVLPGVLSLADTLTVDGALSLTLRGCGIQSRLVAPAGKPAFVFTNGNDLTLDGLRIDASCPDAAVQFIQSANLTVVNCSLLNTVAADAIYGKGLAHGFGPALSVDGGRRVEIRENQLVGLPAVQANGRDMELLHNTLMGGGIQVIPPSVSVQIEDNLISGGEGPGIQLGGGTKTAADYVGLYYTVDQPVEMTMKKAASRKARAEAVDTVSYASDFAPKTGTFLAATRLVTITRNLIGRMTGSGIVTETDLTNGAALGDVDELLIAENQIILCASTPDVTLGKSGQVCGGIAAIGLFGTRIVDNFIAANGRANQAACGIFILDGSDIQIEGNVIAENGTGEDAEKTAFYQAGIAAQYVFGNFLSKNSTERSSGLTGYPAVRIQDNQVVCPAGQALSVTAIGGVVIDGNTLSTRERLSQPTDPLDFGVQGACVYVADAGLPIWNPNLALLIQILRNNKTSLHIGDFLSLGALESALPDGRILFHNNQVSFNTDVVENVVTLGEIDSGFAQRAWKAATFSALFISLDDISVNDNQFQATVPPYLQLLVQLYATGKMTVGLLYAYLFKFMQVGTLAPVIRADGNGLNEKLFSNYISYASSAGAMNVTTSNTATHFFLATGPKTANANNLTLF